jgi:hypothetical protein
LPENVSVSEEIYEFPIRLKDFCIGIGLVFAFSDTGEKYCSSTCEKYCSLACEKMLSFCPEKAFRQRRLFDTFLPQIKNQKLINNSPTNRALSPII